MTQRDHTVIATILVILGLYIIGLNSLEIQPWDEGLYAVRGEGIVLTGNGWDQTPHALGGLYSSTAPPVSSWGVAGGVALLGRTSFGVRLFTILCSGLALFLMFHIVKKFSTYQGAVVAAIVLGTSLHWMVYSRQAMTEVPLMTFTLLALWSTLHNFRKTWWVFALALAAALMTKMAVSFVPLIFLLPLVKKHWPRVILAVAVGLMLAAPWYVSMAMTHGSEFWMAMTVPHVATAVEGNTSALGPLHYVNQLVLAHPALIVAFFFVPIALLVRPLRERLRAAHRVILLWFVATVLIFGFSATQNPHYVVMLIPAAVMVAVMGFDHVVEYLPRRWTGLMYVMLIVASVWAADPHMRATFKSPSANIYFTLLYLALCCLPAIVFVVKREVVDLFVVKGYKSVVVIVLLVGSMQVLWVAMKGRPEDITGGRRIASRLLDESDFKKSFAYIYHRHNDADSLNPQLAWYTAGWMSGWDADHSHVSMSLPEDDSDISVVAEAAFSGQPWVVYYHPGKRDVTVREVMAGMATMYDVEIDMPHYSLFKRR